MISSEQLQADLQLAADTATGLYPDARVAIAVHDLNGEPVIKGINSKVPHEALSLAKLGIVLTSARQGLNETWIEPEAVLARDKRAGGPLEHLAGDGRKHGIKWEEAVAATLLVSDNTGPQVLTRMSGGPAQVNQELAEAGFVVSKLLPPGTDSFETSANRYLHGLTTADEAARLFGLTVQALPKTREFLSKSNDTFGLRREVDQIWGNHHLPEGFDHPADVILFHVDRLTEQGVDMLLLDRLIDRLADADWTASQYPSKAGIDDDPEEGTSTRHDVAQIGGLIVATLATYPYHERSDFHTDKRHPAHDFQAQVGKLVAKHVGLR